MAEWVPPDTEKPGPHPTVPTHASDAATEAPHRSGTYVVQVPKDQIYRVPPPQNAYLAEQYRNHQCRKLKNPCVYYLSWILGITLLITVLLIISGIVFYLVVKPGLPKFDIKHVTVKNPHKPLDSRSKPEYDITIKTKNPSVRMGFFYKKGSKAILSHRNIHIATGKPPDFYQGSRNATLFKLVLHGRNIVLPKEIERSLKGQRPKHIIRLSLTINFPVTLRVGELITWVMDMAVMCDVRVRGLTKGTHVVSQDCRVNLKL